MSLRLLVVEGNIRDEREAQRAAYGHAASEAYADVLRRIAPGAICDICFPADPGANVPDASGLAGYDGVAITGSALNLYDGGPEIAAQIELARAVFASATPMFGSCWGLQVACAAAGGGVMRNPLGREIGVARNIALSEAGRAHPLLEGRPAAFDAPCTHLDIVALPPRNAVALASNALAPIQAAEIRYGQGIFWGVQYHPEFSLADVAAIIERRKSGLMREGFLEGEASVSAYVADLRALDADPDRSDLARRLGLDAQVTDALKRRVELHNFIDLLVRPEKSRRGRA
jgi:GMP synthase (glutamine-hydrolysing)